MNPTIHDVARLANTSKSTVSRYLNGGNVKKKTKEALEKAITELNYHPNANARNLVLNKTRTIAIVVDSITNTFYSQIIAGIEQVAAQKGYNCIFLSWTSNLYENETSFLKLVLEGKADGIILISFRKRDEQDLNVYKQSRYPVILIGDNGGRDDIYSIDVDNYSGIEELVKYLYRIGHRNIAYISGPKKAAATKHRLSGYLDAVKALRLNDNPQLIMDSDWSNKGGYKAMEQLLHIKDFTAVIASNDETAIGALRALQQRGFQVPEDFSVAGFDDIPIASWVYPRLTTMRQPFRDIGTLAAERMLQLLTKDKNVIPGHASLMPKLIIRDSCGKI